MSVPSSFSSTFATTRPHRKLDLLRHIIYIYQVNYIYPRNYMPMMAIMVMVFHSYLNRVHAHFSNMRMSGRIFRGSFMGYQDIKSGSF